MFFSKTMFRLSALLGLLYVSAAQAHAQESIRVAVAVTEMTGGVIESGLRVALRSLGDVVAVSHSEPHDYVLAVNVLCSPNQDCTRPGQYAIAAWLFEPLTAQQVVSIFAAPPFAVDLQPSPEQIRYLQTFLAGTMRVRDSWTLVAGVQTYEQMLRELVARLDSGCFESRRRAARLMDRVRQSPATPFSQEDLNFMFSARC